MEMESYGKKTPPALPSLKAKPTSNDLNQDVFVKVVESESERESLKKSPPAPPSLKTKPTNDLKNASFSCVKLKAVESESECGLKKTPPAPPCLKTKPSKDNSGEASLVLENIPQLKDNRRTHFPPVPDKKSKPTLTFATPATVAKSVAIKVEHSESEKQPEIIANQNIEGGEDDSEVERQPELTKNSECGNREITLQRTKTIMMRFKKTIRQKDVESGDGKQFCQIDINTDANVDEKDKNAKRAYLAAEEIMTSEKTYVDVLKILDEFRRSVEEAFPEDSPLRVHVKGRTPCFSLVPTLLEFNSHLLEELEDRIENWESRKKIADVLAAKAQFLKIYSRYLDNFKTSRELFEECTKKFPAFSKFLKEFQKRDLCQGLGVLSHMLAPVQRIPRYKILLEAYLKNQDADSEDFEDSKNAQKIVSRVADSTNESLIALERRIAMQDLNKRVQKDFELIQPSRELLKEARMVNLSIREVPQPWQVILVTDFLLFAYIKVKANYNNNKRFHFRMPLEDLRSGIAFV